MPTTLCMSQMVDLALGTPDLGVVNFNVLHTLLHAMLQVSIFEYFYFTIYEV